MPGPYDVGNAPGGASYAAPLMQQQLMEGIGSLPETYFKGKEMKRQLELQKPVEGLTGDTQKDIQRIISEANKRGGLEYAKGMIPLMLQQQELNRPPATIDEFGAGGGMPAPNGQAAGPGNLQPPRPPQPKPKLSSAGTDNAGAENLASIASESGLDLAAHLPDIAKRMGVTADQPLTPAQAQAAKALVSHTAQLVRAGTPPQLPPGAPTTTGGPAGPAGAPRAPGAPATAPQNGAAAAPPLASGPETEPPAAAAPPAPAAAPPAPGVAPQPGISTGLTPPPAFKGSDVDYARFLRTQAGKLNEEARRREVVGLKGADQTKQRAQSLLDLATKFEEQAVKRGELTPKQKDVASGAEQAEQNIKIKTARYEKVHGAVQAASRTADQLLHYTQLGKGILNQPNVYFGSAEQLNLAWKKLSNVFDKNGTEPLAQEAYRKTVSAMVLAQVNQMKDEAAEVGGGGRIFQQQVALMEQAAGDPNTTIPALRLLTEVATRNAKMAKEEARQANAYVRTSKSGTLDEGFSQQMMDYWEKHPMFSPEEIRDIRLISPPEFKTDGEARRAKLPTGTPFKVDGNWRRAP